jgi:hypothetical protein
MASAEERDAVRRPWLPACLAAHGLGVADAAALSYVVVDELVEAVATLGVHPWPAADGHGRLRFDGGDRHDVTVDADRLHTQLYRGWLARRPRVGDVFAVRIDEQQLPRVMARPWEEPLGTLLVGPVYDLGAEARKVARLALHAVRSDLLTAPEAKANRLAERALRNERPAPRRSALDPSVAPAS